jgi:hypothetical protein
MDADFSVELGAPNEEATLELPWDSGVAQGPAYFDLRRQPEMLPFVDEAVNFPELGDFLRSANSRHSIFQTVKCDAWSTNDLVEEEEVYECEWKFGSYVDLVFAEEHTAERFSFFHHEELVRSLVLLLKKAPDISAACEAVVRRCYYHDGPPDAPPDVSQGGSGLHSGFYITLYLFGYGDDVAEARERWGVAMRLAAAALLQLSAAGRKQ